MLQICLKLPGKQFVDPPFEEEILTFMRELGYSRNIKLLSDVKVEMLPQPWRTFGTIINMEDLVFQIENKESRKNKYMYYPRFTKVIINHLMSQDQSIPRRNKVDWHISNNDPILTTMRFIPQYEVVQKYGVILPDNLTNQAMKESEAYKTYFAFATGKAIPKPKYVRRSTKEKTNQAPEASSGKRLKATAKVTKLGKKKQPAKGLDTLSEVALTEAEKMKIALKRIKTQQHSSHASGSGKDEGNGVTSGVPDVPSYDFEAEQISWKSSDEEDDDDEANIGKDEDDNDQGDEDERIDSDNDGDDFVHPKFSIHDEEDSFDPKVQTPSHVESTDDEDSDEEIQGANVKGDEQDEEEINEEVEANELYRDVNVNLVGRDTEMTDAPRTLFKLHNPDTGIDSIFNLNTKSTSLIDIPVTTIAKPPLLSATTPPLPPTPLITHLQQTPVPTPATVPSSSQQDIPNFGSLFGFDHRLKTLENDFSKFNQTNQFTAAVASIPGIVDTYLANKMNKAVKTAI
ncbi:hypothetical protein Tco_0303696 [Tanacetum coccineum]